MTDINKGLVQTAYVGSDASGYDERRFISKQGSLFNELEWRELKRVLEYIQPNSRLLDVGCGTGRFSVRLCKLGYETLGIDPSQDMINIAKEKSKHMNGVVFKQELVHDLKDDGAGFDLTFTIRVTNQIDTEENAILTIKDMIRLTKSGGFILIDFVNRDRFMARQGTETKLGFDQLQRIAGEESCDIMSERGLLFFGQGVLERMPNTFIQIWSLVEKGMTALFPKKSSRGYVLMQKK